MHHIWYCISTFHISPQGPILQMAYSAYSLPSVTGVKGADPKLQMQIYVTPKPVLFLNICIVNHPKPKVVAFGVHILSLYVK